MELYSWFLNNKNVTSSIKHKLHKGVPNNIMNCTMWPTAKVRNITILTQPEYIKTNEECASKQKVTLKEH